MRLNDRELATVLVALRHWQEYMLSLGSGAARQVRQQYDHFTDAPPLTVAQIDRLCERINTKEAELVCTECGEPCFLTTGHIAHHGEPDEIDHDADADHVALPGVEQNPDAVALGRRGGKAKSAAKVEAARANGAKGGRPKKQPEGA